ncbi:hypothetical protein APHAL10511_001023 [Amanita phalloides]|nr:hypothetical protein APHAL10511_001023 [Amanita phalloides]
MAHDGRSAKRIKLDDAEHLVFDDPSLQKRASELCSSGTTGAGFLSGRVFMAWAPTASMKIRFIMETEEVNDYGTTHTHKFSVIFAGACSEFFTDLALHARDEIMLSLKGARVESTNRQLRTCTLAMTLVYEDGVVIILKKHASGLSDKVIDTWKLSQNWFDSPAPEESRRSPSPPQDTVVKITKKEQRRRKKALREQSKAEIVPGTPDEAQLPITSVDHQAESSLPIDVRPENVEEMTAGLQTDTHKYHPIGDVSVGQVVDLAGVVVRATPPAQTRTGDWSVNIKIVDPSSPTKVDSSDPDAFGVNCFTKPHSSWLPQPKIGDVLLLRRIQISNVKGHLKGTAHHNRFQWAIYSPERETVQHEGLEVTPKKNSETDIDCWIPSFDPDLSEIGYCMKLSEWWRKRRGKRTSEEVDTVNPVATYESAGAAKRLHRLIKDTGPAVQPNGYFDCTVEVLHGHMNNNEVFSLYVTDYTRHDLMTPLQADWCPLELNDRVLKIEMWDGAAKHGPQMEPGAYYAMANARMRLSRGGYLEAKMVLPRIVRLKEEDVDRNIHLKDLLARKDEWKNQNGIPSNIEDKLIEEVVEDQFFNCVVEVLHVAQSGYGPPYIYATDYTAHPYLQPSRFEGTWCKNLEGRVVKISLWDCHSSIANSISPEHYYSIKKLRLRLNPRGDSFEGELRGRERLIDQLNIRAENKQLQELIRRKERFLNQSNMEESRKPLSNATRNSSTVDQSTSPKPQNDFPRSRSADVITEKTCQDVPIEHNNTMAQQYTNFKEMIASEICPNKFLVRARAVDFYPLTLKDCSRQFCTRCKVNIPAKYKACIECSDTEYEFVTYRYQIFLMLEDDEGTRVVLSVYDKSHLLNGLERANFDDNTMAYDHFCARLSHLLGNLVEVHEKGVRGIKVAPATEAYELEVVSWGVPDGKRAYGLYRSRGYRN